MTDASGHINVMNDEIKQVVNRSNARTTTERVSTFNLTRFTRLQEFLRAEFPILLHALGENLFGLFTLDYLRRYPSRIYNLNSLAENFQQYLVETLPDTDAPPEYGGSWPDFIIDLAIMERAFNQVFDGPGVEGQQILDADQSIQTTEGFMETRFLPVVCLKLFVFRYPVSQYFTAVRNTEDPAFPEPAETFLAMIRREHIVRIYELTRLQFEVLGALVAGQPLSQVVSLVAETSDRSVQSITSTVFAWINDWAAKGFFAGIER